MAWIPSQQVRKESVEDACAHLAQLDHRGFARLNVLATTHLPNILLAGDLVSRSAAWSDDGVLVADLGSADPRRDCRPADTFRIAVTSAEHPAAMEDVFGPCDRHPFPTRIRGHVTSRGIDWLDATGMPLCHNDTARYLLQFTRESHLTPWKIDVGSEIVRSLEGVAVPAVGNAGSRLFVGPIVVRIARTLEADSIIVSEGDSRTKRAAFFLPGLNESELTCYQGLRHSGMEIDRALQSAQLLAA